MAVVITVTDIFTIKEGDPDSLYNKILTKNKKDILCCVSSSDSDVVEIWETSTQETGRNIIYSSLYSNFLTPSGAGASSIVQSINTLLTS